MRKIYVISFCPTPFSPLLNSLSKLLRFQYILEKWNFLSVFTCLLEMLVAVNFVGRLRRHSSFNWCSVDLWFRISPPTMKCTIWRRQETSIQAKHRAVRWHSSVSTRTVTRHSLTIIISWDTSARRTAASLERRGKSPISVTSTAVLPLSDRKLLSLDTATKSTANPTEWVMLANVLLAHQEPMFKLCWIVFLDYYLNKHTCKKLKEREYFRVCMACSGTYLTVWGVNRNILSLLSSSLLKPVSLKIIQHF